MLSLAAGAKIMKRKRLLFSIDDHSFIVIMHSKYKEAVSTGTVLRYLAVIVSVPASSASYLNAEKI